MRKIIEILRLKHEAKLSHEKIARALGISKGAVSKYLSLAKAKGVGWPLPGSMDVTVHPPSSITSIIPRDS